MKCVESHFLWDFSSWKDLFNSIYDNNQKNTIDDKDIKLPYDENQLILQLARLYVISPERIVLLLTTRSLNITCEDINDVLQNINVSMAISLPISKKNLYVRLYEALKLFNMKICNTYLNTRLANLGNHHECLHELREDLIECEGPADWFEKSNKAIVCQYFNDIINCNYIKAAMLCGIKPAVMLRDFSKDIMKIIVPFKCKISRALPRVDDPMPAKSSQNYLSIILLFIGYFLYLYHLYVQFIL